MEKTMGCLYLTPRLSAEMLSAPEAAPYFIRLSVLLCLYLTGCGEDRDFYVQSTAEELGTEEVTL